MSQTQRQLRLGAIIQGVSEAARRLRSTILSIR